MAESQFPLNDWILCSRHPSLPTPTPPWPSHLPVTGISAPSTQASPSAPMPWSPSSLLTSFYSILGRILCSFIPLGTGELTSWPSVLSMPPQTLFPVWVSLVVTKQAVLLEGSCCGLDKRPQQTRVDVLLLSPWCCCQAVETLRWAWWRLLSLCVPVHVRQTASSSSHTDSLY